jgi:hypothetical protein
MFQFYLGNIVTEEYKMIKPTTMQASFLLQVITFSGSSSEVTDIIRQKESHFCI